MTSDKVYERLTEIFHDVFNRDDFVLTPTLTAADVKGWDSMKHIELIMHVEECYSIRFTSKEIDGLTNVGDFARLISQKSS